MTDHLTAKTYSDGVLVLPPISSPGRGESVEVSSAMSGGIVLRADDELEIVMVLLDTKAARQLQEQIAALLHHQETAQRDQGS